MTEVVQRARPLLGTCVAIRATADDAAHANAAIDAAFAVMTHVHERMSYQSPDSDLAAIGRAPVGVVVPLDSETHACLAAALAFAGESGGVFDPVLPDDGACWRDLRLSEPGEEGGSVRLARRLRLDLSGIAKGHAVDRACASLRAGGVSAGIVDAGGDIGVFGAEPEVVALKPAHSAPPAAVRLVDGALASSDVGHAIAEYGAARHRDGRTGRAVTAGFAAVAAPTCRTADALTKIVLALGPDAVPTLRRHGVRAWLHRPGDAWLALGKPE